MFGLGNILKGAMTLVIIGAVLGAAAGGAGADTGGHGDSVRLLDKDGAYAQVQENVQMATFAPEMAVLADPNEKVIGTLEPAPSWSGEHQSGGPGAYAGRLQVGSGAGYEIADDYKAGPGCMVQCIIAGVSYARGVDSELRVWTDTPAHITVWVHNDQLGYSEQFSSAPGVKVKYFNALFEELEPHTTYQAMAVAVDADGYASQAYGSLTTLTRNVEIGFSMASVVEQPYGNGDPFGWAAWAEGEYRDSSAGTTQADGTFVQFGQQSFALHDVNDEYIDLRLLLWQIDESEGFCGAWALPKEPGPGSNNCQTWAEAVLMFPENDIDDRPASATSWTEHTLTRTLSVPGSGDLWFTVPVVLEVWYD